MDGEARQESGFGDAMSANVAQLDPHSSGTFSCDGHVGDDLDVLAKCHTGMQGS